MTTTEAAPPLPPPLLQPASAIMAGTGTRSDVDIARVRVRVSPGTAAPSSGTATPPAPAPAPVPVPVPAPVPVSLGARSALTLGLLTSPLLRPAVPVPMPVPSGDAGTVASLRLALSYGAYAWTVTRTVSDFASLHARLEQALVRTGAVPSFSNMAAKLSGSSASLTAAAGPNSTGSSSGNEAGAYALPTWPGGNGIGPPDAPPGLDDFSLDGESGHASHVIGATEAARWEQYVQGLLSVAAMTAAARV
jgi:hypothetical protein